MMLQDRLPPKVRRMREASSVAGWDTTIETDGEFQAVVCMRQGVRMKVWFHYGKWSLDDNHRSALYRPDGTAALLRNTGAARKVLDPDQPDPVAVELVRSRATGSLPADRQWRSLPWRSGVSLAEINRHLVGPVALLWRGSDGRLFERVPPEGSVSAALVQRPAGPVICLVWAEETGVWSVALGRMLRCEPPI